MDVQGLDIGVNDQPVDSDLEVRKLIHFCGCHLLGQEVGLSEQPCPIEEFSNC